MAKKLDQYRGRLTAKQIAKGMNAARMNALRLLEDAETLFAVARFPTATSLAILSIEESGKIAILRHLACVSTPTEIQELWRDYRSHTRKNVLWPLLETIKPGRKLKFSDFEWLYDKQSDHPYILDQVKQIGFYTDCLGKINWSEPQTVIDQHLAKSLLCIAATLCSHKEISEEEVILFAQYVGPAMRGTKKEANEALIKWYAAMQTAGLAEYGTNTMEQFLKTGLQIPLIDKEHLRLPLLGAIS
jgi:AbiV family abortive infection protein